MAPNWLGQERVGTAPAVPGADWRGLKRSRQALARAALGELVGTDRAWHGCRAIPVKMGAWGGLEGVTLHVGMGGVRMACVTCAKPYLQSSRLMVKVRFTPCWEIFKFRNIHSLPSIIFTEYSVFEQPESQLSFSPFTTKTNGDYNHKRSFPSHINVFGKLSLSRSKSSL